MDIAVSTVITLTGADAANYMLEQPTHLTACIYAEIIAATSSDHGTVAFTNLPGTGENIYIPIDKTQPATFYRVKVRMVD